MDKNAPDARHFLLDGTLEIRNDQQGRLDDVVGQGVGLVRLERINESSFWGAVYHPNNMHKERVVFRIVAVERDGKPAVDIEWDEDIG